tara:strand:+ start:412 stop:513 length:102 start_codon:yes stop_codon:yes gene_type:complete
MKLLKSKKFWKFILIAVGVIVGVGVGEYIKSIM